MPRILRAAAASPTCGPPAVTACSTASPPTDATLRRQLRSLGRARPGHVDSGAGVRILHDLGFLQPAAEPPTFRLTIITLPAVPPRRARENRMGERQHDPDRDRTFV